MSLGVHFALGTEDEARLLAAAGDDDAVLDVVEDIEMGSRDSTSCDMTCCRQISIPDALPNPCSE